MYSQNIAGQKANLAEPLKASKIKTASSEVCEPNTASNKSSTSRRHKLINQIRKVASSEGTGSNHQISFAIIGI